MRLFGVRIIDDPRMQLWETRVPDALRGDPLWRFHTYRVAIYLLALARDDVRKAKRPMDQRIVEQLLNSVASVSANVAEGYGRPTMRDRARFYSIALGSLRESCSWYLASSFLPSNTIAERLGQLSELRRLLMAATAELSRRRQP